MILDDYINLLWSQVGKGIYVYGGNGENLSAMTDEKRKEYMTKRETETKNSQTGKINYTKEQNIARCEALYQKRLKAGINPILAFDCSGLQYWAGKQTGVIHHDLSANTLYGKCTPVEKKDIKRGDYCFLHNGKKATHVGMYVGDDIIIECQGRDVGVVTNKLSRTTVFNRFGRYAAFGTGDSSEPVTPAEPVNPAKPDPAAKYVVINGKMRIVDGKKKPDKRVHIRKGNGTEHDILKTAYSEERYPLIKQEDSKPYWYRIECDGREAFISSNSRYTHVEPCD
jgi:Cell wall-associated hydrolases (invasion-associated proteins)